jgi:hypothetical protein
MSYSFRIYGLSLTADRPIPGVPPAKIANVDVSVYLGKLPKRFDQNESSAELWFTSEYQDQLGVPLLKVFKYFSGEYFRFTYADQTEFVVDRSGANIWATLPESLTLEDTSTYLLGPIMGFVLQLRGSISLHASAVVIENRAVAFVGPAGSGKSTTAAALAERGYSVIAEDVVTIEDCGDTFLALPAYPCIRLWPASVRALYGSEAALPKLTPTWEKRFLDLSQERYRFSEEPVPLTAIFMLAERSQRAQAPFVSSISGSQALLSLIANTYTNNLMDKETRARGFDLLSRMHAVIPVCRLTPHVDPGLIPKLCETIVRESQAMELQFNLKARAVS